MGANRATAIRRLQVRTVPLLLRGLAGLPPRLVVEALGAAALLQASAEPGYVRRVVRWVRRLAPERPAHRVALALLRNRGRFLAIAAWPSLMDPDAFRRRTAVEGLEHLEAARRHGGVILLGFHLGPGMAGWVLARAGHPSTTVAGGYRFRGWPAPRASWGGRPARHAVLVGDGAAARALALHRVRRLLLDGATVRITADGALGDVAFPIPLAGEQLVVRKGWWALRRQTGAGVLPVLTRLAGGRVVVTLHPPLPPPDPDDEADLAACRAALEPLVVTYARRFPDQCLGIFRTAPDGPAGRHDLVDPHVAGGFPVTAAAVEGGRRGVRVSGIAPGPGGDPRTRSPARAGRPPDAGRILP
jgi:lauroyl/myristoyl acyltransferase